MNVNRLVHALSIAGMATALLSACGGGGDSAPPAASAAGITLQGVVATGPAFQGATVTVQDSTDKTVTAPAQVGPDGRYSVDITGLTAPLVISASGAFGDASVTLVSVVADPLPATGTLSVSVSPLTHAVAAMLAPSGNPAELKPGDVTATAVDAKVEILRAAIANVLTSAALDPTTFNPMRDAFVPGTGTGGDKVVETVKVSVSDGQVTLRDVFGGATSVTLTPATTKAEVAGASALPAPPSNAPNVAAALASSQALQAAFNKCFAAAPADRATFNTDGSIDLKPACADIDPLLADDYLNSSYSGEEIYGATLADAAMTGAAWRAEIDSYRKGDDGNDYATIVMRFTRSDGSTGNRVDTLRKLASPGPGALTNWHLSGNRRPFDATVNAVLNRYLYLSPERPVNNMGVQADQFNGTSYYESGLRLYLNPTRHPNVRAVRVTNAQATGPLPAAGVVLAPADLTVANGCGRDDRLVIANQSGNTSVGPVTFRSGNTYVLDRASVDSSKPISKYAWKPYNEYAPTPILAPVPAYTRYRFEVFYNGNNSATPDATFTAPHIAAVPLASAGASYIWAEIDAATRAYIQPGAELDLAQVSWTLPAGAQNPSSVFGFSRIGGSGTARTSPNALPATPLAMTATLTNVPRPGCAVGNVFPTLSPSGFSFRGVGLFHSDSQFVRHENGVEWVNQQ